MRYHRDAHNKSVQNETPSAQQNPTGTKRKRTAAQNNPAGAKKRTLAAPKRTLSAPENTLAAEESTVPVGSDQPVIAQQPLRVPRPGLDNSHIKDLPAELRSSIIEFQLSDLPSVAIVAKTMIQRDVDAAVAADFNESSLVFATKSALSKTCNALHAQYASELSSQVMSCKVPSLALHVQDFDFAPFISELFSEFEASHRAYFNAGPGAITIHLTLTPSFFDRNEGERGLMGWLARRDKERTTSKVGLVQWLEWTKAEEQAGRKVSVEYELVRNAEFEGVEDREALRMFLLLFDSLGKGEGEMGGISEEIIEVFEEIKDKEDHEAQEALEELEDDSEDELEDSDEEEEDLEEEDEDSE